MWFIIPGRGFAAASCDYLFTTFTEIADAGRHVVDIREWVEKKGRGVGVYTVCHVVCRETQQEAEDYYTRYAITMPDHAAYGRQEGVLAVARP
jgi:alkanesulfonate monooxygenase SsuD/methylene tetrahydromethanopterin reductase-like flavin-dependent oxidoreductase (luciferase family)